MISGYSWPIYPKIWMTRRAAVVCSTWVMHCAPLFWICSTSAFSCKYLWRLLLIWIEF